MTLRRQPVLLFAVFLAAATLSQFPTSVSAADATVLTGNDTKSSLPEKEEAAAAVADNNDCDYCDLSAESILLSTDEAIDNKAKQFSLNRRYNARDLRRGGDDEGGSDPGPAAVGPKKGAPAKPKQTAMAEAKEGFKQAKAGIKEAKEDIKQIQEEQEAKAKKAAERQAQREADREAFQEQRAAEREQKHLEEKAIQEEAQEKKELTTTKKKESESKQEDSKETKKQQKDKEEEESKLDQYKKHILGKIQGDGNEEEKEDYQYNEEDVFEGLAGGEFLEELVDDESTIKEAIREVKKLQRITQREIQREGGGGGESSTFEFDDGGFGALGDKEDEANLKAILKKEMRQEERMEEREKALRLEKEEQSENEKLELDKATRQKERKHEKLREIRQFHRQEDRDEAKKAKIVEILEQVQQAEQEFGH